ncbi:hypothetical protein GWI33_020742 [Rhynchophorus ferrugineus]|uniref:Uncharacterized protein n=1 Tax=Rhynchophorus ferrugineus TaxID=354439 RepID=A0A834M5I6_RHYFE|nr:hypothetical protein GWI33_020742 [Rhynchophorus ferrugineus]
MEAVRGLPRDSLTTDPWGSRLPDPSERPDRPDVLRLPAVRNARHPLFYDPAGSAHSREMHANLLIGLARCEPETDIPPVAVIPESCCSTNFGKRLYSILVYLLFLKNMLFPEKVII